MLDRLARERGPILAGAAVGPGWFGIIERLDADLAVLVPDYTIDQVKEKFGTLRFHAALGQECDRERWAKAMARIEQAEQESAEVCEECGAPGLRWNTRWVRTLCEVHGLEHYARGGRGLPPMLA